MSAFRFPRRRAVLGTLAGLGLASPAAWAALPGNYPSRPITLIVPFGPGGVADVTARAIAQEMGRRLGQTIVVDNRPGAGGIVATSAVARAAPDGHTLLLMSNGNAVSATLFKKLPYDTQRDLLPVSTLGYFDLALCVGAKSRFKTLGELVEHGRKNPGQLTVGTITVGSTQHLSAELFKTRAGIDAVTVPYRGSPDVIAALRTGQVDLAFEILTPLIPHLKDGAIRALAVSAAQRNPALPEVPTVQEAGIAQYDVASWNALAAPTDTPRAIVDRLNAVAREAVAQPSVQQHLQSLGVRAQASSPAELGQLLDSEIKRWRDVIVAAKIEPT